MFSKTKGIAIQIQPKNKEELLIEAIRPGSNLKSKAALNLVEEWSSDELSKPYNLTLKRASSSCSLDEGVKHTVGTQCLIYLFDPGNGWIRDCMKRGDMLLMTAQLVKKGVSLEGLYYERGSTVLPDQSFKQIVQHLINARSGRPSPPAILNEEIINVFTEAGYSFTYPPEFQKFIADEKSGFSLGS